MRLPFAFVALVLGLGLAAPAAAAEREVLFGDAFRLAVTDAGPFDRLVDGRLVCLSEACAGRTVTVGGHTVRVGRRVTVAQAASRKPPYRAPTAFEASAGGGRTQVLLFGAGGLFAACAAVLLALELRGRRGVAPVDELRRALRLVRESAGRSPVDRRRALDHLAATLGPTVPAERATRLAWDRPAPEPEATLELAEDLR